SVKLQIASSTRLDTRHFAPGRAQTGLVSCLEKCRSGTRHFVTGRGNLDGRFSLWASARKPQPAQAGAALATSTGAGPLAKEAGSGGSGDLEALLCWWEEGQA